MPSIALSFCSNPNTIIKCWLFFIPVSIPPCWTQCLVLDTSPSSLCELVAESFRSLEHFFFHLYLREVLPISSLFPTPPSYQDTYVEVYFVGWNFPAFTLSSSFSFYSEKSSFSHNSNNHLFFSSKVILLVHSLNSLLIHSVCSVSSPSLHHEVSGSTGYFAW